MAGLVSILANPTSRRATSQADELDVALRTAGWTTLRTGRAPGEPVGLVAARVEGSRVLVVVGGDGTVRLVSDVAAETDIPIWHARGGNENLFARSLGMDAGVEPLLAALEAGRHHRVDQLCGLGETGLLMMSTGFDARVVQRVSQRRTGAVSNLNYLRPATEAFFRWRASRCTIDLDGERIIEDQPGWVVVANSPDYCGRLNPVPGARMDDGLLDVCFAPMKTGLGALARVLKSRLRLISKASIRRGRHVNIKLDSPALWQVDGDLIGSGTATEASIQVRPACIPVLLPACQGRLRAISLAR